MSAPELQLKLSPRARKDFRSILLDTGRTWGERQVLVYRDLIHNALNTLRAQPGIGHQHHALPETHRIYPVGSHIIVYRQRHDTIEVFRILHERMSLPLHI